ncbi:hypothetical protein niasHT_027540 [Heterodera trifolii]|uniref:RING-type E3 ubiquitin transferase n=1 Tax=Heterodera trifolii TaxID=157864 RepID=A0ABD2K527_9BILA
MSLNPSADPLAGIYQKELTEYDLNRLPHTLKKGEDDQLLKRSDLIDTLSTEFSCPICLDLLKNTMVTECLHRFCSECIKKCIYKGNRECPTCRKKIISKRNLRADPNMDKLIDKIWPDREQYEALQREKAQKWSKHFDVVALQRSIAEGMRAQAKALSRHSKADGNEPTTTKRAEVSGQVANKAKKASPPIQHNGICAPKKLCLLPRHVMENDIANADFYTDSSSESPSSSSGKDTSFDPTSDAGKGTQLSKSLIVDVDVGLFNKSVDDRFIGQLTSREAKLGGASSNVAMPSPFPCQTVEDESSGIWSASSSSSPYPANEILRLYTPNPLDDCNTNFGINVSMESALREYVSKTGQLGLITVEIVPLPKLRRPIDERFRMKLMHRATVEELRVKFVNICKNMAKVELSFFVQMYNNKMTRLYANESMCTVLALARRPNFFDYPTVFFNIEAIT